MEKYVYMRGDNPEAREAAETINLIIQMINLSGNKKPGAVLYLGQAQKWALRRIESGDPQEMRDKSFGGWPIVWVEKESYAKLAV
jgi:hypothetical protein